MAIFDGRIMALRFQCSHCKQFLATDEKNAGKTVVCPACKSSVKITAGPPVSSPPDPLIGKRVAHYLIEQRLGEGGMGKVYRAKNLRLNKTCAIKILPEHFAKQDASLIERFVREAQAAANVEHPNVLPVHFVGKEADTYFIEMQYVDGGTLEGLMEKQGKLPPEVAARIIRDVAAGLGAAHAKGVIHRDIKPSNIMLTKDGQVMVVDFGLARMGQRATRLTMTGTIMGTPLYMSPEQGQGLPADHRSDIYSLGVMLYRLLAGAPPFQADTPVALIHHHVYTPPPDILTASPDCPPVLAAMVARMMAKKLEERYQSCNELWSDLEAFLAPPGAPPEPGKSAAQKPAELGKSGAVVPKRRSALPVLVILMLLLAGVGGPIGYFTLRGQKQETAGPQTAQKPEPAAQPAQQKADVATAAPRAETGVSAVQPAPPAQTSAPGFPAPSQKTEHRAHGTPRVPAPIQKPEPPAPAAASAPSVDLQAYSEAVKPINERIDFFDYEAARSRTYLLKAKYADLGAVKLANVERMASLRKGCFDRVNTGKVKLTMENVSRRYAFAGDIQKADEKGLTAKIRKTWDSLTKEEIANFYRTAADPKSAEDSMCIAAFLMEGNAGDKDYDQALGMLGKAAGLGADVSSLTKYLDTLRKLPKARPPAGQDAKAATAAKSETQAASGESRETAGRPPSRKADFENLFNGKDFDNWVVMGNPERWSVRNGVIHCEGGKDGMWLRSAQEYGDFILKLEWRLSEDGNSGVFLRAPAKPKPWDESIEVQMTTQDMKDPKQFTGALVKHVAPPRPTKVAPNVWHHFEIRCVGRRYTVILDDVKLVDVDGEEIPSLRDKALRGYFGMQDSFTEPGRFVEFRNIRVKRLDAKEQGQEQPEHGKKKAARATQRFAE